MVEGCKTVLCPVCGQAVSLVPKAVKGEDTVFTLEQHRRVRDFRQCSGSDQQLLLLTQDEADAAAKQRE